MVATKVVRWVVTMAGRKDDELAAMTVVEKVVMLVDHLAARWAEW
jgi:hypothetical protein